MRRSSGGETRVLSEKDRRAEKLEFLLRSERNEDSLIASLFLAASTCRLLERSVGPGTLDALAAVELESWSATHAVS